MRALKTALFLCLGTGAAAADTQDRLRTALAEWVKTTEATWMTAASADALSTPQIEAWGDAPAAAELASLSKYLTAICALTVVKDGQLTWQTDIGALLGHDLKGMTVGQAVTHSGGLAFDGTQRASFLWVNDPTPRWPDVPRVIALRGGPHGAAGEFEYSNENYALLALAIEAVTGEGYRDACAARVLAPAGVEAPAPSDTMAHGLPWGGWRMGVGDYLRFARHWLPATLSPSLPEVELRESVTYGLGLTQGPSAETGALVSWHFGGLCLPGRLSGGSLVLNYGQQWTVVVAHDACLTEAQSEALLVAVIEVFDDAS